MLPVLMVEMGLEYLFPSYNVPSTVLPNESFERQFIPARVFSLEASAFMKCLYQSEIVTCSVELDSETYCTSILYLFC